MSVIPAHKRTGRLKPAWITQWGSVERGRERDIETETEGERERRKEETLF
jgi:hypothetical protein